MANHSGDITSNETWYLTSSPHIVTAHLYIKNGAQVTIEAGCQVKVDSDQKIEFVSGSMIAEGTALNHIVFTKNSGTRWGSFLSFGANTYFVNSSFDYCDFEYLRDEGYGGCIRIDTNIPSKFDNITMRYCLASTRFYDWDSNFTINNLTIIGDGGGVGSGCKLWFETFTGTMTINNLEVYDNKLAVSATGSSGKVICNNPIIYNISSGGNTLVFAYDAEINYGLFYNIPHDVIVGGGSGTIDVTNCTFYNCLRAVIIPGGTPTVTVRNCIFSDGTHSALSGYAGTLNSRYNWFYNNVPHGNYLGTISDKTGDDTSETDPELITGTGADYGILPTSPCATSGEGYPYEDYAGYSIPALGYPSYEGSDTLILSDEIELNLTLAKQEESDSVTLSDAINVAFIIQQELLDTLNLNDDIEVMLSTELSDTLTLADAITVDTVEPSVNDFNNIFGMVKGTIEDIDNKVGFIGRNLSDINNKVGFLKSWQVAGDAGYQSLGKTYIKVYINSVEQTDIDVDSITITKILNAPHTADFILGRPYDNNKPSIELPVEIKYHIWTLYKGYITQINPTDSPDSIRLTCQDNYWKQNKTKKWFNIGHKPQDNRELYYNTISEGLSACGASFGIGGFIPQTMNLFGTMESDAISRLVTNSGNFAWYYNIDGTKKLWTAGQGDVIYLEKQELGTNLGLHQVLRHSFRESIERVVNKFRVQMGNLVWRRFNDTGGVKSYAGRTWNQYLGEIFPKWNNIYERVATNNYEPAYLDAEGNVVAQVGISGVLRHSAEENNLYQDVFVKYDLPGLNSDFESWSDRISPHVIVNFPFFTGWKLSASLNSPTPVWFPEGYRYELSEGFTIDYEKGQVIFNEPMYLYQSDAQGNITHVKKAKLHIAIYKEQYYSDTEDPSDDPETNISNPLMFFTEKLGDYSETIIGNLTLSGLGIQVGGWYIVGRADNNRPMYRYTPSWNDTAFATDFANWRLTQNSDTKIIGSIDLTIDTIQFYNITLDNRIMIDGVIENPLNITSISYNIGNWRVSVGLENKRYFKRSVSIPSHGE